MGSGDTMTLATGAGVGVDETEQDVAQTSASSLNGRCLTRSFGRLRLG
jgi:hypothetical protein